MAAERARTHDVRLSLPAVRGIGRVFSSVPVMRVVAPTLRRQQTSGGGRIDP